MFMFSGEQHHIPYYKSDGFVNLALKMQFCFQAISNLSRWEWGGICNAIRLINSNPLALPQDIEETSSNQAESTKLDGERHIFYSHAWNMQSSRKIFVHVAQNVTHLTCKYMKPEGNNRQTDLWRDNAGGAIGALFLASVFMNFCSMFHNPLY